MSGTRFFAPVLLLVVALAASPAGAVSNYVQYSEAKSFDESGDVKSVVGGKFRPGNAWDLVYLLENGTLAYRQSNGSARSLASSVILTTQDSLQYVYAADLSGDGYDDLVVLDNDLDYYVYLSNPNATSGAPFQSAQKYTLSYSEVFTSNQVTALDDLAFGDVDGDGDLDLVFAASTAYSRGSGGGENPSTTYYFLGNYAVAKNDGAGGFPQDVAVEDTWGTSHGTDATIGLGTLMSRVSTGDFNGDGALDLVFGYHTTLGYLTVSEVKVVKGDGSGSFDASATGSGTVGTGHYGCQDVAGFVPGATGINTVPAPGQKAYLAIAFDRSSHYLEWNTSWNGTDVKLDSTPRGPMGPPNDYNLDGVADLMYTNGDSSELLVGYDWAGDDDDQRADYDWVAGTDIQTGSAGDFDGDGKIDLLGIDGDDLLIYWNSIPDQAVIFYKDTNCTGGALGSVPADVSATYDLTGSDPPVKNDQASSMMFQRVGKNLTVTVYDSPSGDTDDDWAEVTVLQDIDGTVCVGTFETTTSNADYSEQYHKHSGFSISTHDLNGKVSRIVVSAP